MSTKVEPRAKPVRVSCVFGVDGRQTDWSLALQRCSPPPTPPPPPPPPPPHAFIVLSFPLLHFLFVVVPPVYSFCFYMPQICIMIITGCVKAYCSEHNVTKSVHNRIQDLLQIPHENFEQLQLLKCKSTSIMIEIALSSFSLCGTAGGVHHWTWFIDSCVFVSQLPPSSSLSVSLSPPPPPPPPLFSSSTTSTQMKRGNSTNLITITYRINENDFQEFVS